MCFDLVVLECVSLWNSHYKFQRTVRRKTQWQINGQQSLKEAAETETGVAGVESGEIETEIATEIDARLTEIVRETEKEIATEIVREKETVREIVTGTE